MIYVHCEVRKKRVIKQCLVIESTTSSSLTGNRGGWLLKCDIFVSKKAGEFYHVFNLPKFLCTDGALFLRATPNPLFRPLKEFIPPLFPWARSFTLHP